MLIQFWQARLRDDAPATLSMRSRDGGFLLRVLQIPPKQSCIDFSRLTLLVLPIRDQTDSATTLIMPMGWLRQ